MQGHIPGHRSGDDGIDTALVVDGTAARSRHGAQRAPPTPLAARSGARRRVPQHFPKPGWVSHDAGEIWESVRRSVTDAIRSAGVGPESIAAIGITNQRETTVVWDKATRKPIDLAIVWQCRRTADVCNELKKDAAVVARVREKTGLVIDAYFSATKIAWRLLDNVAGARARAEKGESSAFVAT